MYNKKVKAHIDSYLYDASLFHQIALFCSKLQEGVQLVTDSLIENWLLNQLFKGTKLNNCTINL